MSDIIRPIEPFELTQGFGENPASYARFGLDGHNGWDFRTKFSDTPKGQRDIMASWLMEFYRQGDEGNDGYGKYFETVCRLQSTWKLTFAHCHSIQSFSKKSEGETMAISDSTGNVIPRGEAGAHLHFTVKKILIVNGVHQVQNYNNGFFGAVDPQEFFDDLRAYKKAHGKPVETGGLMVQVDDKTFANMRAKCDNRDEVWADLKVSLDPVEPKADKALTVIGGLRNLSTGLQRQLSASEQETKNKAEELERFKQTTIESAKVVEARMNGLEKELKESKILAESMGSKYDVVSREKGNLLLENTELRTKLSQAQEKGTETLSLSQVFWLLFPKIKSAIVKTFKELFSAKRIG